MHRNMKSLAIDGGGQENRLKSIVGEFWTVRLNTWPGDERLVHTGGGDYRPTLLAMCFV